MPIVDKSKLKRPEITEIFDYRQNFRNQVNEAFFNSINYTEEDYLPIWNKVEDLNKRWLNGENISNLLSMKEITLLVKHLRFYVEYSSDYLQQSNPNPKNALIKSIKANDVPCEWFSLPGVEEDRVILYFHGGGHIMGSSNSHKLFTLNLAKITNMNVLSINYRLAPEHPHPADINDCVSTYEWLLFSGFMPKNIIIAGDSAGGNLTLLTLLKLRDDGISLPAGAICLSPATDMVQTGDSVKNNCHTDIVLGDLCYIWWFQVHLAGTDPYDPAVSPLYADLKNLPPILIQVSTSEMLYDDSKRFYDKAKEVGVDITLQTWDDAMHVFQRESPDLSEAQDALEKIKEFTKRF